MSEKELSSKKEDETKKKKERTLEELSATNWLTPQNASFLFKNGFLYIKQSKTEEQRAFLYRQFPFELQWEYISVMDSEQQEIGILRSLDLFDAETEELLKNELKRRYYTPVIQKILSMKERYGFSYWKVITPDGEIKFTLQDTFRSIVHVGENRLLLLDVNGNRFEIPDATALDRKSYKKIELYL